MTLNTAAGTVFCNLLVFFSPLNKYPHSLIIAHLLSLDSVFLFLFILMMSNDQKVKTSCNIQMFSERVSRQKCKKNLFPGPEEYITLSSPEINKKKRNKNTPTNFLRN